jgi:hypothetical protein
VSHIEHAKQGVLYIFIKFFTRNSRETSIRSRRFRREGERECLGYSQSGDMNIVFLSSTLVFVANGKKIMNGRDEPSSL